LSTVFEILYDADIMRLIQGAGKTKEELASEIWEMYGGNEMGGINTEKIGARNPHNKEVTPESEEKEEESTENTRWKRLPAGKNIGDITNIEELGETIQGIMSGLKKPPAPPPGAGGMPPGLAKTVNNLVRLASVYDFYGKIREADVLDGILRSYDK
jgi:hypothetical protein